jgi:ubiquitin-conjugating enzyme E2 J1
MLLTPNGRFETLTKICLSITSYHEEHWQPSWSVRTALTAIRAFMVTPSEGALGGIDFSEEQRRELAEKSRANEVNFTFGSEKRREVTRLIHEKMLGRMGKAKQAAKKMAMEARERKEKEARESSSAQNGDDNNVEVRTTTTQAVAEEVPQRAPLVVSPTTRVSSAHSNHHQQQQQQQQQHAEPSEEEHHQAPSPTRTPRNANAAATYQRPPALADNNRRTQPPEDDRTSAMKLLDSLSVCLIVAITAILLKRCMWVPPL